MTTIQPDRRPAIGLGSAMVHALAKNWWLLLLRGIAAIIFGVLAFAWPGVTLLTLILFYGAFALVDGVLAIIAAITGGAPGSRWWLAIVGLLGIAAGLLTFLMPGLSALVLLFFIAGWAIATGVFQIMGAIQLRKEIDNEWFLILGGIISVLFGIGVMLAPGAGALALVWVIGAYALIIGVLLVALAFRLKKHARIDFWFTMGSTYSFLSVMRLAELERSTGIPFRWRPFHLLIILQEMKYVPFADKPTKLAYMWRDVERRAALYGIPAQLPAPYPAKHSVAANLVATVGMREGWGADFVRAAYRRWFQLGQETGSEPNISESLRDIGQEPGRVLALANSENAKMALAAETDAARELGIFGSPTFVVDRELFWGDDRLEEAISWKRSDRVRRG